MIFDRRSSRKKGGSEPDSDPHPHRASPRRKGRSNARLALILVGVAFVFYFGMMVYFGILAQQSP